MSKRYFPITVVAAILAVVAVIGYTVCFTEKPVVPVRVLLPNSAGQVVFDHTKHVDDFKVACKACHHDSVDAKNFAAACGSCHGAAAKANFRTRHVTEYDDPAFCATCHHPAMSWDHDGHQNYTGDDCMDCHHNDARSVPKAQGCKNCHKQAEDGKKPSLGKAGHKRCSDSGCHDVTVNTCSNCHQLTDLAGLRGAVVKFDDCQVCHVNQEFDDIVRDRMAAFHDSCIKCHEKAKKGPFDQKSCNQCHTK